MSNKSEYVQYPPLDGWRIERLNVPKNRTHAWVGINDALRLRTAPSVRASLVDAISTWANGYTPYHGRSFGLCWNAFRSMRNRWEHYNKPVLRREVSATGLPVQILPRTSPVWNSLVQGLMQVPVVDELRKSSKLSYMQIKRTKVRPYEGVVFTNNAFQDMLGKRFFVNVAGAATGRLSSTTPTPQPQVPEQEALSGHSSDGSSIQKHSIGDTYPFIVQGFEHEGRTMYEWVNHQKRWAGRLCRQAVTAYKSVQMLLKYGTGDLSPSTLKSFKESYEARHGYKRYSPVPPKPVNGSDFARIKTLADLKPSESAAARPYEQSYTRHAELVYRVVLDDDSVLWLSYLPSEKSLLDSPKTGLHQLIKGITTYRREK